MNNIYNKLYWSLFIILPLLLFYPLEIFSAYTDLQGDYLKIAVHTEYGHLIKDDGVLPEYGFQYPVGTEHLQEGVMVAGFYFCYFKDSNFYKCRSYEDVNNCGIGIKPVSQYEYEDAYVDRLRTIVQSTEGSISVNSHFILWKDEKFLILNITISCIGIKPITNMKYKRVCDWDVNSETTNNWDDLNDESKPIIMAYHSGLYVALASSILRAVNADISCVNNIDNECWKTNTTICSNDPDGASLLYNAGALFEWNGINLNPGESINISLYYIAGNSKNDIIQGYDRAEEVNVLSTGCPSQPDDGGDYTYSTNIKFSWTEGSFFHPKARIINYHLQVGTYPGGNDIFDGVIGNIKSYTITGCSYNKSYYARVRAEDNLGYWTEWSPSSDGILCLAESQIMIFNNLIEKDKENNKCTILYKPSKDTKIYVRVYNMAGEIVRDLVQGDFIQTAQEKEVVWDGKDENQEPVKPGLYFMYVKTDDFKKIIKVVVK